MYLIRCPTGNQCHSRRARVAWSRGFRSSATLAAAFNSRLSGTSGTVTVLHAAGRPASTAQRCNSVVATAQELRPVVQRRHSLPSCRRTKNRSERNVRRARALTAQGLSTRQDREGRSPAGQGSCRRCVAEQKKIENVAIANALQLEESSPTPRSSYPL